MERIDSDYVVPENDDFETVPDGQYSAEAIEFFTLDEATQRPILVEQKNGRMVARARVSTSEGQEPPVSVDLAQAKLLVMAFGGDLTALPPIPQLNDPDGISTYLEQVEVQCTNGTKTPKFRVSSGWADVTRFAGAIPPKGNYSWRIHTFEPEDDNGRPHWLESNKYPGSLYFFLFVECMGDGMGNPSPYSGLVLSTIMSYKVEVSPEGQPRWTTIKGGPNKGQYSKTAVAFSRFVEVIAPSWFDGVKVADVNNILPELLETIKKDNVIFSAFAGPNEKGFWDFMHDTAVSLSSSPQPQEQKQSKTPASDKNSPQPDFTKKVIEVLARAEGVDQPFKSANTLDITDECLPVLKKYLTPAKEAGVITVGRLELISTNQLISFLEQLPIGDLPADVGEQLVKITTQLKQEGTEDKNSDNEDGPLF